MRQRMKNDPVEESVKWLLDLSNGRSPTSDDLESLTLHGLRVIEARKGFLRCNFVVPDRASDSDGNWHPGAMATLIDDVGASAVYSAVGHGNISVDFAISYYSTAKMQEEVEIEAKFVGKRGKLGSVMVEVRRKDDGELIALGKQWMAPVGNKPSQVSKL